MAKKKKKIVPVRSRKKKRKNSFVKPVIISLLFVALAATAYYYYTADKKVISKEHVIGSFPEGFSSFGIDLSHHQGQIDWEELMVTQRYDTIVRFVYCKATEGSDFVDSQWEENRSALNELDIPNGAYHFFSPKSPPRPQAAHFLSVWKRSDLDLPPVLDVESEGFSDGDLIAKMKIWLEEVEQKTGMRPVIYTSLHFFETKFMNEFKDYKFWIAAYSRKPDCIEDGRIIHWQFSESGELPGIDETVDFNVSKIAYY